VQIVARMGWNLLVMVSRPGAAAAEGTVVETLTGPRE
jgi:hypothetical protein